MKIAAAQLRPRVGDVQRNLDRHLQLIDLAAEHQADLIVFPELSLTGYEPRLVKQFALANDHPSFSRLQTASEANAMTIVVGAPLKSSGLPQLSALIFQPDQACRMYSKQFLHTDEIPYFAAGGDANSLIPTLPPVAIAICFELSVRQHAETAFESGAEVYLASVAKTSVALDSSYERLTSIAKKHSAVVMMANSVGKQDSLDCGGGSSAWGRRGNRLASLGSRVEALLIVDEQTERSDIVMLS